MIKTKKQMFTVIGAFIFIMLLGTVTYAFFNYTRTGVANRIQVGRIYFSADQGSNAVTLSDLFPITLEASEEVSSETPGVGSLTLHVTGDASYDEGIEYRVKAVDVSNSTGGVDLPISIAIKYEANQGKTIGVEDEDYFTNRGHDASLYKVLSTDSITDDGELVVGYIAKGQTGIDGNITIMAYLDARNIAISDTYPEGDATHTETSGETSVEVVDYTDGTTSNWVDERTVLTTAEWNALQSSGVSFKIKVEAQEGIWVTAPVPPVPTIPSCPGCKFTYITHSYDPYYYGGASNPDATVVSTMTVVTNDYRTINKPIFLGFTETQDGKVDRAFTCGIKGKDYNEQTYEYNIDSINEGTVFCMEGTTNGSTYNSNLSLITGSTLWNDPDYSAGRCVDNTTSIECNGAIYANIDQNGYANLIDYNTGANCAVTETGQFYCDED